MWFAPLFVMASRSLDRLPRTIGDRQEAVKATGGVLDGACIIGPYGFEKRRHAGLGTPPWSWRCRKPEAGWPSGCRRVSGRGKYAMEAYRIGDHIVAADTEEDARHFYREEIGMEPPAEIEELSVSFEVPLGEGRTAAIRDLMNKVLDERSSWLRMGVPCELHWPFVIAKLK